MRLILILLGMLWIILGFLFFVFTDRSKEKLRNILKEKNIKLLSVTGIIIGIVLIRGSSLVSAPWFAIILGIFVILKGLFFIFGPEKKTKPLIDWWMSTSNNVYKTWGVVAFLLGVILLLML